MLVTKLHAPTPRAQWIARDRLLERLRAEPGVRLTVLVAPPGSGKTTLLGTWLERETARRPVAWVSLDEADNDPLVLWSHVLESLRGACPELEPVPLGDAFLPELVNGISRQADVALILDDFNRLDAGAARDGVAWLAEHAPPSLQLVVATRSEPALSLPALRAHGELCELRARELAFTVDEAELFLNDRLGLGLGRDQVGELVDRTEGWATGLYLAALSLGGDEEPEALVRRFGGSSRHVVDFLVDEVLDAHDPAKQTLMLRCSVLERLCGPLCDALLGEADGAEQLSELARTNLFLVPLDNRGQWYRFHHLFRQLLRVELEHRDAGLVPALHARAADWHRDHGSAAEAIEHLLAAGSFAEAGDLICARWIEFTNLGQHATVLAWLQRLPSGVLESSAALLAVNAWVLTLCGRREEALEAIAAAERLGDVDEGSVRASLTTLRALPAFGDVGAGYENAIRASELEQPGSPFWPVVCWARGIGHFYRGELAEADRWLADAARSAPPVEMWMVAASALVYRSFVAGERGDLEAQQQFAEQAMQLAEERKLQEIDGEVPIALAASLAARGRPDEAASLFEKGIRVLRSSGQPIDLANALVRQARLLRSLGEPADGVIAEARATVDSCADAGVLDAWVSELERPPRMRSAQGGVSRRELAVLRALTGPLSQRDIARELFLSHNTVHSHTRSIYRKLGVSSRTDAVREGRALGLI